MTSGKKIAFTICAANYLGKAKALLESVDRNCPDYQFYIVLVDSNAEELALSDPRIIPLGDVPINEIQNMRKKYDVIEFSTSVKPFCFQYLFARFPEIDQILYLDPDIYVFSSFEVIDQELLDADILLTPHLLTPVVGNSTRAELRIAPTGVYNLGFIGLKRSENTDLFLNWWGKKLEQHSVCDHKEGLFYDQNWMTYASVYFDRVRISRNPGLNIAVWNLGERKITKRKDKFLVNEGYLLTFFHFSQFQFDKTAIIPLPLAAWEVESHNGSLQEVCEIYRTALVLAGHSNYESIPYLQPGRYSPKRIGFIVFGRLVKFITKYLSAEYRTLIRRQMQGI
jgi:hypothetical protein